MLEKFKMKGCKEVDIALAANEKLTKEDGAPKADAKQYRQLIGSLLYLTATKPDIMYATSLLSRFMHNPREHHLTNAKRVLKYIKATIDYGIKFTAGGKVELAGFTDSDWAGSVNDMKSTSGYAFFIGNGIFSWLSQKQETIAQSSAEAEYIAACAAVNQAIWLRRIMSDLGEEQDNPTKLNSDSKSAIAIAKNPVQHRRTKHIMMKFHFVREAEVQSK